MQTCRKCGCTDERACPGGCFWVETDLCSSCVPIRDLAETPPEEILARREQFEAGYGIEADGLTWMSVHSMLSLALKHPGIPAGDQGLVVAREFRDQLGAYLVDKRILKPDERALIEAVEEPLVQVLQ